MCIRDRASTIPEITILVAKQPMDKIPANLILFSKFLIIMIMWIADFECCKTMADSPPEQVVSVYEVPDNILDREFSVLRFDGATKMCIRDRSWLLKT